MIMSHDGKWFVSLEDNVDRFPKMDHPQAEAVGRYYQTFGSVYAYQSRVCYKFERLGNPLWYRNTPMPVGMIPVGSPESIPFKVWDGYSGTLLRDLILPMPENIFVDRAGKSWNEPIVNGFCLSHDDSMLIATLDSNVFLWDIGSGDISQIITRDESLKVIGFSTDDRFLICHDVNTLFIWEIKNQAWVGTYHIDGQISKAVISDTNRIAATIWNGEHWEIAVIDLVL